MSTPPIQPRTLKGFRDYLPEAMLPRERIIEVARRVFRSYGYSPIDTPALEYLDVLLGKGGAESDKQLYRFQDHGGRDVGLRFDLTVPLARFAAQHAAELGTPFKRYHIAPVWRGENTQRGRFREFMQCDFDTIGTTSAAADVETILVVHDLLRAIGFERFTIHVNNRLVLAGLLESLGLESQAADVLRVIDKLPKIGPQKVAEEIVQVAEASTEQAARVVELVQVTGTTEQVLARLQPLVANSRRGEEGAARLAGVFGALAAAGLAAKRVRLDVSIARGLDYYTGIVLETTLDDLPDIGSVASGGRYDNLAELFTKQQLPGIGASLGLDRLLAAMEELGMIEPVRTPAEVFIPYFEASRLGDYLRLAAELRAAGLAVEVYPDPVKLGKQLQYADRRGHRVALIAGERELAAGECQVKNLAGGDSTTVARADVLAEVRRVLAK
jgi:histidyl-tRNA synthetase